MSSLQEFYFRLTKAGLSSFELQAILKSSKNSEHLVENSEHLSSKSSEHLIESPEYFGQLRRERN